jgi:predicted negative regulator of RcsB-dependent stress response
VEIYNSEEEQIEALKRWWRENGRSAVIGVTLGIAAIIGWNVWQTHKENQALEASALYQQLLDAVEQKQNERAEKLSTRLSELYASTPYAIYGGLFLAKLKTDADDLIAAHDALKEAIAATDDTNLKHVARIRLIRLMLANSEAEEALQRIAEVDMGKAGQFEGNYKELEGDCYVALGRPAEALTAYRRALGLGNRTPFLQMKIEDLAEPTSHLDPQFDQDVMAPKPQPDMVPQKSKPPSLGSKASIQKPAAPNQEPEQ